MSSAIIIKWIFFSYWALIWGSIGVPGGHRIFTLPCSFVSLSYQCQTKPPFLTAILKIFEIVTCTNLNHVLFPRNRSQLEFGHYFWCWRNCQYVKMLCTILRNTSVEYLQTMGRCQFLCYFCKWERFFKIKIVLSSKIFLSRNGKNLNNKIKNRFQSHSP